MKKKIILSIVFLFFLQNCGFTPIYSKNNSKKNFSIENLDIDGDLEINNYINSGLKRFTYSNKDKKVFNIEKKFKLTIFTDYNKNVLTKDLTGTATDYELVLKTNIDIEFDNSREVKKYKIKFTDRFNMKKNDDKYEEKSYEKLIKKDFANSLISKIIFHLSNEQW